MGFPLAMDVPLAMDFPPGNFSPTRILMRPIEPTWDPI
jgi:hypothetical protein